MHFLYLHLGHFSKQKKRSNVWMMIIQIYRILVCLNSFSAERCKMHKFSYSAEETLSSKFCNLVTNTHLLKYFNYNSISLSRTLYISFSSFSCTYKKESNLNLSLYTSVTLIPNARKD